MKKPQNHILVIFGASGDLTQRKLIPALFNLFCQGMLPEKFAVLGVSRTSYSDNAFRKKMGNGVIQYADYKSSDDIRLSEFLKLLYYLSADTYNKDDYFILKEKIKNIDKTLDTNKNIIFYLATPPNMFEIISQHLMEQGLHHEHEGQYWRRIVIEKPFGYDLKSAQHLNTQLRNIFQEKQIFRIDHYLGKETVQNLLAFRFSNGIFESLWNRNFIDHVEITAAENIGIETRGDYYDHAGALRDMIQNHLMQLVGLTAMEPPVTFDADSIRTETAKVFQSLKPMDDKAIRSQVIRGQYLSSEIKNVKIPGYREESNVRPDSKTETFVAIKFFIYNWRWSGVPFYIRTGKHLPTKATEIVLNMKSTPLLLFKGQCTGSSCNKLVIRIQPDEGILLQFSLKIPGEGFRVKNVSMDFKYSELTDSRIPTAYERLLHDSMTGDSTLYLRNDSVEATWKFVDPILKAWQDDDSIPLYGYPAGTWGPKESHDLLFDKYTFWRNPCKNLSNSENYCEL